ncbi:MAG TPA: molybdopterin-dependent oxidoreductase, partial [Bacteroidia bacterium]|nr:molybdopterin-dependent oxidoreductase [Bacteroidia bacterium]
ASTPLATSYLRVAINGDLALFRGLCKAVLAAEAKAPGTVLDHDFIREHTCGFEEFVQAVEASEWDEIESLSGLSRDQIETTARTILRGERKLITCWAMGLTQHTNAVATIREVVNLHLLLGAVGRPGAGLCPVRGHSNVQGDRTMGIFEKMPAAYHDAIDREFGFQSPRKHGYDVVASILAMHRGEGKVFFAMGGNFLQATPDTEFTAEALRKCSLTAHVSTKLNRSHVVTGRTALILPCLGRSDEDRNGSGELQFSTVENSMGIVHQSQGTLQPVSDNLLSETMIVARLADATLGGRTAFSYVEAARDHDRVRDLIESTLPGFEDFNVRVRHPGGFYLPNGAKERVFHTSTGKANFSAEPVSGARAGEGELMLMTIRSHDQFNTTVYGLNDRYRGIGHERRILFMHPEDMAERGLKPLAEIDIRNESGGRVRIAERFLAIPYDLPRGAVAGYFPELNVLVPIGLKAAISHTPCSKSVPVTIERREVVSDLPKASQA